jgi:hypothetical protein
LPRSRTLPQNRIARSTLSRLANFAGGFSFLGLSHTTVKRSQNIRLLAAAMRATPFTFDLELTREHPAHLADVHRYALVGRSVLRVDLPDMRLDLACGSRPAFEAVENLLFDSRKARHIN